MYDYDFGDINSMPGTRKAVLRGAQIFNVRCYYQGGEFPTVYWTFYEANVYGSELFENTDENFYQNVVNNTGQSSSGGQTLITYCLFANWWNSSTGELISSTMIPGSCWQTMGWTWT